MDTQKEEDDFNYWFNKQTINAVPDADLSLQRLWASLAWQAAKAQAVPEGFVLVPKEPTLSMQRAGGAEAVKPNSGIVSMRDVYKAMIKAQEPK